ncbi:hypothetical protein ACU4GI_11050 [Cupriavidus basilensis]
MAAIVNDRDQLLQATSPRLLPVTIGGNVTVPPDRLGNGSLPGGVTVPPGSLSGGTLPGTVAVPALNVTGTIQTTQLSAAVVTTLNLSTQNLSANQIVSGTINTSRLAADVITTGNFYAQTINASQINAGTMSASRIYGGILSGAQLDISTPSGLANGYYFRVNDVGYLDCGLAIIGALIIGSSNNTSTAGVTGFQMAGGFNLVNNGYVNFNGRPQNNGATLTVRGQGSSTNNHAGRFFYQLNDAAVIKSAVVLGSPGGYSVYTENGTVGPFTASHDALIPKHIPTEEGMVLEDVACVRKRSISDTIFEVRPVQGMACKRRAGVVSGRRALSGSIPAALIAGYVLDGDEQIPYPVDEWADLCERYDLVMMNAVGEGQILVCGANGDIEHGDFISSSGTPGIGMRQDGAGLMNYTIAQARESIHFESPSDVRLAACYYHCG